MRTKGAVIGAVVWTVGFLVSAVALRGNPIGDWVEGALLAGWIVFVSLAGRPATRRKAEAGR